MERFISSDELIAQFTAACEKQVAGETCKKLLSDAILSKSQKMELRVLVHNTLDFCGPVISRVEEWCKENGITETKVVELLALRFMEEYEKLRR